MERTPDGARFRSTCACRTASLPAGESARRLRGWSHAAAAVAALATTVALYALSGDDRPRALSMLVFGVSMIVLYAVGATYHIGRWQPRTERILRAIDHANIYVLIAGMRSSTCS